MSKSLAVCCRLFAVGAFLGVLAGCSTMRPEDEDPSTYKVLTIGNVFSISVLRHLPIVAREAGRDLDLASLFLRENSASNHWANALRDGEDDRAFRPYRFDRIVKGVRKVSGARRNIGEVLRTTKWNAVVIQHDSSGKRTSGEDREAAVRLVACIRKFAPQADVLLQEPWSGTPWDPRLKELNVDQGRMYEELHASCRDFADSQRVKVIPVGAAVQAWRRRLPVKYAENSFGGDVVGGGRLEARDHFERTLDNTWIPNGDVVSLNLKGEYLQSLVWACVLGMDLSDLKYRPACVTEGEAELMADIARGVR